jgi:hypothetical protein
MITQELKWAKSNNFTLDNCAELWYLLYLSDNVRPKISTDIREFQILEREHIEILERIYIELTKNHVRFGREIADNRRIL